MRNFARWYPIGFIGLLIVIISVSSAIAGPAEPASGRVGVVATPANNNTTVKATATATVEVTTGGKCRTKTIAVRSEHPAEANAQVVSPAASVPTATSVSWGGKYGCKNNIVVVSRAELERNIGEAVPVGSQVVFFCNRSLSHTGPCAGRGCEEGRRFGHRFGQQGAFCRTAMTEEGDVYTLRVCPADFAGLNGETCQYGFQVVNAVERGQGYFPSNKAREAGNVQSRLGNLYIDPVFSNGVAFRGRITVTED